MCTLVQRTAACSECCWPFQLLMLSEKVFPWLHRWETFMFPCKSAHQLVAAQCFQSTQSLSLWFQGVVAMNRTSAHTSLVPFFSLPQTLFRVIKIACVVPYILIRRTERVPYLVAVVSFVVLCGDENFCTVLWYCRTDILCTHIYTYAGNLFSVYFVFTRLKVWIWSAQFCTLGKFIWVDILRALGDCDEGIHFLTLGLSSSKQECRKI